MTHALNSRTSTTDGETFLRMEFAPNRREIFLLTWIEVVIAGRVRMDPDPSKVGVFRIADALVISASIPTP
jgi:hypothetical protein